MTQTFALIACLTSSLVLAQTVPGSISFNARLTDTAGAAISGSHAMGFALYDTGSGGAALWTENASAASFSSEGVTFVELGATTPLTTSTLDGRKLYLEVSVDGTTLLPRLAIVSVPYAIRASLAATALTVGSLTEAAIQRRVTGTCNAGQAVRSIDASGGVQCENLASTGGDITAVTTAAGSGLIGGSAAGDVALSLSTCTNGQVLMSNGTGWACSTAAGPPGIQGPPGVAGPAGPAAANAGVTTLDLEFDEASGTTFADISGYGNTANVLSGGVISGATGHTSRGASFAGGAIVVPAPTKIPDSPQVWVEAWVQPQVPLTGTQTIATRPGSYTLQQSNGDVQFTVIPSATGTPCTATSSGGPLIAGNWQHVAGWYDGLTVTVTLNGTILGATGCPNGPITATPTAAFNIGGVVAGTVVTASYSGRIDELRVRQIAAQQYSTDPSTPLGDIKFNRFVTRVVGATSGTYNGHIVATVGAKNYYGRAATTVICQAQFGAGARMCSLNDLTELMAANAVAPVTPDSPVTLPTTAFPLPTVGTWINAGQIRVPTGTGGLNMYNDCFNWSGGTVAGGGYGANYYIPPNSSWPYGYTEPTNCSSALPLMCCK